MGPNAILNSALVSPNGRLDHCVTARLEVDNDGHTSKIGTMEEQAIPESSGEER